MARPPKNGEDIRTETIRFRVTQDEKNGLWLNASQAGFTPSDFIRSRVLGAKPARRVPNANQELLIRLKGEVGKLGSNINQIARALNRRQETGQLTTVSDRDIARAMSGVDELTKHLLELLGYGH